MKKVKVLYFVDRLRRGGIQSFVYENIKFMDSSIVQVDFLLLDDGEHYDLEDELIKLGCNIYKLKGIWINTPFDYLRYYKSLNAFYKKHHDYDVVHLHSSSKNFLILKLAKKYGIKNRIAHSHNINFQTKSKLKIIIGNILKNFLIKYATDYFACSEIAGKWLFGNRKVKVVKNAVNIEKYKYDDSISESQRNKLNIKKSDIVIGHVGRFVNQKNHIFLIEIFKELYKKNENYKLLLIGTGELENTIIKKVEEYGLKNSVIFSGFHTDVEKYLQAMDLFVFPSLFEGLGLVLIEAQAAGLTCYASKSVIPEEAKVSDLLHFIDLTNSAKEWANIIASSYLPQRVSPIESIRDKGYDINQTAKYLQDYYVDCMVKSS